MKKVGDIINKIEMIAPCGINCSVCSGHLRDKKKCPGCLSTNDKDKPLYCTKCIIKVCEERKNNNFIYCFNCMKFPCLRLKSLDKRYRIKYRTSLINNLKEISEIGVEAFTDKDNKKWLCKNCDSVISIHKTKCSNCNKDYAIERNYEYVEAIKNNHL